MGDFNAVMPLREKNKMIGYFKLTARISVFFRLYKVASRGGAEMLSGPTRLLRGSLLGVFGSVLLLFIPSVWVDAAHAQEAKETETKNKEADSKQAKSQESKPAPAEVEPAADDPDTFTHPITVTGRAIDSDGKPIEGARIYLVAAQPGYKRLAETTSAADGSYKFEEVPLPIQRPQRNRDENVGAFEVFGTAKGHALAWRPKKHFLPDLKKYNKTPGNPTGRDLPLGYGTDELIELDLTFTAPQSFRGQVIDDYGKPLADVTLAIRYCDSEWELSDYNSIRFLGTLEALNQHEDVPPEVKVRKTDAEGRFEFTNLPSDYRWQIDVKPPGRPPRSIWVVTGEAPLADEKGVRIFSGDFNVMFPRPLPVKFRIVYGDTGKPAEKVGLGGMVSEAGFWKTSDADGLIEAPLPKGRYKLSIFPRYRSPYLRTDTEVEITEKTSEPITLRLDPAGVVEITVVDADTGKPIPGVDVWRDRDVNGPRPSRSVHGYRSWEVETSISHFESPKTDKDGKMRVNFEPGRQRIGVGLETFPEGYEATEPDGVDVDCEAGKPVSVVLSMRKKE